MKAEKLTNKEHWKQTEITIENLFLSWCYCFSNGFHDGLFFHDPKVHIITQKLLAPMKEVYCSPTSYIPIYSLALIRGVCNRLFCVCVCTEACVILCVQDPNHILSLKHIVKPFNGLTTAHQLDPPNRVKEEAGQIWRTSTAHFPQSHYILKTYCPEICIRTAFSTSGST